MFCLESTNSILLNRFFSRNTFKQIIEDGKSPTYDAVVCKYISNYEQKTNKQCIGEIYQYLNKAYQNEYFYKNTLLNKFLLGIHSPRTTTALTEVPVGNSKADFILINGKAIVYEIKTDLDNFERLDGQISDYYRAFSRVVVVASENNYDSLQQKLQNSPVGICVLTKRGKLSIRKKPVEDCRFLSKTVMFKILRKQEYESILFKRFGRLPNVSQFEYFKACFSMFDSLPTNIAYQDFVEALKKRAKIDIDEYSKVPYELKFLVYFSKYRKCDYISLEHFLNA